MGISFFISKIIVLTYLSLNPINSFEIQYRSKSGLIMNDVVEEKQVIYLEALHREMKFSLERFEVKAGEKIEIWFTNLDQIRHNLLIISPGSLETVGYAADQMATTAEGVHKNWIPDIAEVLYSIPLIRPEEKFKLEFVAPDKPGSYPYVCTFPTHWKMMNGLMIVK